jgi:hypothetical protein
VVADQSGGPEAMGGGSGTGSTVGSAEPGFAFPRRARPRLPQAARPSAATSRPASGVPPWEITDSFLAVPAAPAKAARPGPEPEKPVVPPSGMPGAGAAESSDNTESFPAVDPGAEQRSFPRGYLGDGNESFPAARRRTDADAFRLFPPVRDTGNHPPATPAADDQD